LYTVISGTDSSFNFLEDREVILDTTSAPVQLSLATDKDAHLGVGRKGESAVRRHCGMSDPRVSIEIGAT